MNYLNSAETQDHVRFLKLTLDLVHGLITETDEDGDDLLGDTTKQHLSKLFKILLGAKRVRIYVSVLAQIYEYCDTSSKCNLIPEKAIKERLEEILLTLDTIRSYSKTSSD